MGLKGSHTTSAYKIITPGGQITSNILIRGVCLGLGSKIIPTNLIVINLVGMDVILGMEWMTQHKVILDVSDRVIEINSPTVGHTTLYLPFKDGTDSYAYVSDRPRHRPSCWPHGWSFRHHCRRRQGRGEG
jgi:hypothetical protein